MRKKKKKLVTLELRFDTKDAREGFIANWLDGGVDGGGNTDWETVKWGKSWMRIKGTGYPIIWENNQMIILTPQEEQRRINEAMKKFK